MHKQDEKAPSYGFVATLSAGMDAARARVTEALRSEGFGVLTEIDVQKTFKAKLDVDFRPYLILGACNPTLAKRALDAEPQLGLLLPCNVVLQESEPGSVLVSIADPRAMFSVVEDRRLEPVAREAAERLTRVIRALSEASAV